SKQSIKGSGYLEFTAAVENRLRFVGLADANNNTTAADIDFGLSLHGTTVEVRENGIYRWDRSFKAGDTFRISVENGKVKYAHNGTVFYTSGKIPGSALRADTALYAAGSSIVNAKIATSAITWES